MANRIVYYGWSALGIESAEGKLLFDPFHRAYCGAHWFDAGAFDGAGVVCVTHGHEEHFLDTPEVLRRTGALAVSSPSLISFLRKRNRIPEAQLKAAPFGETVQARGYRITTFAWQHRDINLWKALAKAVFHGNATQLSWAWSSATNAPFYAPYTGFHVELGDGTTVLNYNEGFNTKMSDAEIAGIGRRLRTDVLLAGMQLDFMADVARGAKALDPKLVILYPPHDHFHRMMGVSSRPWEEFGAAVRAAVPSAQVVLAEPGMVIEAPGGRVLEPLKLLAAA